MATKTRKIVSKRTCANPKCRRPLTGRANAKYCGTRCSSAAAYARKQADGEAAPEVPLCFGCKHPTERQGDPIAPKGMLKRHPFGGNRPEVSGYCVDPACPCKHCRPENEGGAKTPKQEVSDEIKSVIGSCPLPRIAGNRMLVIAHKRAVSSGAEACSCGHTEGTVS